MSRNITPFVIGLSVVTYQAYRPPNNLSNQELAGKFWFCHPSHMYLDKQHMKIVTKGNLDHLRSYPANFHWFDWALWMPQEDNSTHTYTMQAPSTMNLYTLYIHLMYIVHTWIECMKFAPKSAWNLQILKWATQKAKMSRGGSWAIGWAPLVYTLSYPIIIEIAIYFMELIDLMLCYIMLQRMSSYFTEFFLHPLVLIIDIFCTFFWAVTSMTSGFGH